MMGLTAKRLGLRTLEGRDLIKDLTLSVSAGDRVAVVGRNGVGKSSLLRVLAGAEPAQSGEVRSGRVGLVRQDLHDLDRVDLQRRARSWSTQKVWGQGASRLGLPPLETFAEGASLGEWRKLWLWVEILEQPDVLLLDEPTENLDDRGRDWLVREIRRWRGALLVVSHDPVLLGVFNDFFVVAEAGCRHVAGGYETLQHTLARDAQEEEARYVRGLQALSRAEGLDESIRRRRARKRAFGRLNELGRCTPKSRLNTKRSAAQVSQARVAGIQDARIQERRRWAVASRRALAVTLPLSAVLPEVPEAGRAVVVTRGLEVVANGVSLVSGIDLDLRRERIGVVGANGAGKSTLLQVLAGERRPDRGTVTVDLPRLGLVRQGAPGWRGATSLLQRLCCHMDMDTAARALKAHGLPLRLAERSLGSLSPGERMRAALLVLCHRRPPVELLILDEPARCLDATATRALTSVLQQWTGGLVVATHDEAWLDAVGVDRRLEL